MMLSIITLNFKTPQKTLLCIDSVYTQYVEEFRGGEMEFIIVDNHSEDESVEKITAAIKAKKYKNVSLIANEENIGFGRGCNLGASNAKGKYLLFLNSDTQVCEQTFLGMMQFLDTHPSVGIMGPQLQNPDGTRQLSASQFYLPRTLFLMLLGLQRLGVASISSKRPQQVDWVSGGAMMVRKDVFKTLGGFDKEIFMYMEDMELCFRAKKQGFLTYYYPQAIVLHASHGSSNRSFAILNIYKGILYFYKKHLNERAYVYARILLWSKAKILYIIGNVTGNSYLRQTYGKTLEIF